MLYENAAFRFNKIDLLFIFQYLVEIDVDTLVVVGVETLDEVDTDEDVETELEVDTLDIELKHDYYHTLLLMSTHYVQV